MDSVAGFSSGSAILIDSPDETLRYITSINAGTNTIVVQPAMSFAHGGGDRVSQLAFAQTSRDLNADGFTDIEDTSLIAAPFGSVGGAGSAVSSYAAVGYQGRLDLNYDNIINIADVALTTAVFGGTC